MATYDPFSGNPIYTSAFLKRVRLHEGFRDRPYKCPAGRLTIGYGRNLDDNPLTKDEAEILLANDLIASEQYARLWTGPEVWKELSPRRQGVVVEMCFQMGLSNLYGFREFRKAIVAGDYTAAAVEMLDSEWHREDSPERAKMLATIMEFGVG